LWIEEATDIILLFLTFVDDYQYRSKCQEEQNYIRSFFYPQGSSVRASTIGVH